MKKKITFLIGLTFLILIVWGVTYFGLKHTENQSKHTPSSIFQLK